MTFTYIKRYSTNYFIREIEIRTIMRYFPLIRLAKFTKFSKKLSKIAANQETHVVLVGESVGTLAIVNILNSVSKNLSYLSM